MTVIDFQSRFKKAHADKTALTPFEQEIAYEFYKYKGQPEHAYLFVVLDPDPDGPYNAARKNQIPMPARLDMFTIGKDEDHVFVMEAIKGHMGAPLDTVMILDLGAELEGQIPQWKTGKIKSPEPFLENPVIPTIAPKAQQRNEIAERFFAGERNPHFHP